MTQDHQWLLLKAFRDSAYKQDDEHEETMLNSQLRTVIHMQKTDLVQIAWN